MERSPKRSSDFVRFRCAFRSRLHRVGVPEIYANRGGSGLRTWQTKCLLYREALLPPLTALSPTGRVNLPRADRSRENPSAGSDHLGP